MPYNPELLETEWNDALQSYDVWYDGELLGHAESDKAAHYMAADYMVCGAETRNEEER